MSYYPFTIPLALKQNVCSHYLLCQIKAGSVFLHFSRYLSVSHTDAQTNVQFPIASYGWSKNPVWVAQKAIISSHISSVNRWRQTYLLTQRKMHTLEKSICSPSQALMPSHTLSFSPSYTHTVHSVCQKVNQPYSSQLVCLLEIPPMLLHQWIFHNKQVCITLPYFRERKGEGERQYSLLTTVHKYKVW